MQTDPALWQALNAYDLDAADAAFPFSRRLARDNGWSHAFACRAIAEYKRFLYLVCVSGHMLTPSDEVDCVWHLHLIYTQDYWDRLCRDTLGRRIDHGPTKGGDAEGEKFLDCYRRTLTLYQAEFGGPPPTDIWPGEDQRFDISRYQRIDTTTHITLPKRQVFLCLAAGAVLLLTACSPHAQAVLDSPVTWFAGLFLVIIVSSLFQKPNGKGKGKGGDGGCGSSCSSGSGHSGGHGSGDSGGDSGGGHGCGSGCGSGCGGGCGGGCGS